MTDQPNGGVEIRHGCRLRFADPGYTAPTPEELRALLRQAGWTGSAAAERAGVHSRTIRKWLGNERDIPYANWRLLLIEAGLALEE